MKTAEEIDKRDFKQANDAIKEWMNKKAGLELSIQVLKSKQETLEDQINEKLDLIIQCNENIADIATKVLDGQ